MDFLKWKEKSFSQIATKIQKNKGNLIDVKNKNALIPTPAKIYRKEIDCFCEKEPVPPSLVTSENNLTKTDQAEVKNALNRARSASGIIKQTKYYTSQNQYFTNRNKSFERTEVRFIRQGDVSYKEENKVPIQNQYDLKNKVPIQNKFSQHALSAKISLKTPVSFHYTWIDNVDTIDNSMYEVVLPPGDYFLEDINHCLRDTMIKNNHYYINNSTMTKQFLLNMVYDTFTNKIQIQTFLNNVYVSNPVLYTANEPWNDVKYSSVLPTFIVSEECSPLLGFPPGEYPDKSAVFSESNYHKNSITGFLIQPMYQPILFKSTNSQFVQQGAVDSSKLTHRKKYDNVIVGTSSQAIGNRQQDANSFAYSVPQNGEIKGGKASASLHYR